MNNLFATLIFSMLSLVSLSQEYHPVIELNKYWDQSDWNSYYPCSIFPYRYVFLQTYTTINGHTYQLCKPYPLQGLPGPGISTCPPFVADTNSSYNYWLREDTVAQKVYIYDPLYSENPDQLLYDFTLNVGDTLQSYYAGGYFPLVLTSIQTVTLNNGETRKKYVFNNRVDVFYIEGIGGGLGLVLPLYFFENQNRMLYCVKKDGENIWGSVCSTVFVRIENKPEISVDVFPSPADDVLNINLGGISASPPYSFEVFDLNGTKVLATKLESSNNAISLTNLSPGFYIYKIRQQATIQNGKLVKL